MEMDTFKKFKIFKTIQLIVAIILFFVFLILLLNPLLRNSIYTNKELFLLCGLLWLFMIYSFITIFFDLKKLRESIVSEHTLNRKAYLDSLTGIPNRYSCDLIFDTYKHATDIGEIGCALFCISNLSDINEKKGREAGDQVLQDFSALLGSVADSYGFVGRNGGNEFIAVLENCSEGCMTTFIHAVEDEIKKQGLPFSITSAYVLNHYEKLAHFTDLISLVYKKIV